MGNTGSTPIPVDQDAGAMGATSEAGRRVSGADEQDARQRSTAVAEAVEHRQALTVEDCPVLNRKDQRPRTNNGSSQNVQYNVYNQRIDSSSSSATATGQQYVLDPRNNMPVAANQAPFPGQKALLSTDRVESNIPKGGTDGTWVYPSPQMFFNALKRKGKGDDVEERDMESVVHAHNTMNELTWREVYAWEMLHRHECGHPTLMRFLGRPDDYSPLARIRQWFGDGALPFDRHDWYIDRCGKEVRYVIDFYFDDEKAGSPDAFSLVVRPALDGPGAALDRVKMGIYEVCAKWGLPCPVTGVKNSESPQ